MPSKTHHELREDVARRLDTMPPALHHDPKLFATMACRIRTEDPIDPVTLGVTRLTLRAVDRDLAHYAAAQEALDALGRLWSRS